MKITSKRLTDNIPWLLLFLLALISATRDAVILFRYPVAVGVNGYYYVLQISEIARTGRPYFATHTPLVLYVLSLIARLAGTPVTTIKAAGILLQIILSLGVFAIIKTALRNNWLALLAVACTIIPQSRYYFTTEYINQLGALVFLVWAGWTFIRAAETRSRLGFLAASGLVLGAFVSHKSALVFAPAMAICVFLVLAIKRSAVWKARALFAIVVLWISPAVIAAQPIFSIPESLQTQISFRPQWPIEPGLVAEELMLAIAASAMLFFVIWSKPGTGTRNLNLTFGAVALWSLLVTLNPFFNTQAMLSGVAGRARLFSYIQIALLVPGLIWLLYSIKRELALYAGAIFLPLLALSILAPLPYGSRSEYLARREELVRALETHSDQLVHNALIIAPHGDQFVVTAATGIPSQQKPAESRNYGMTYWLLDDVRDRSLMDESTILIQSADVAVVLADDAVLQRHLPVMADPVRSALLRANAHLARNMVTLSHLKPN